MRRVALFAAALIFCSCTMSTTAHSQTKTPASHPASISPSPSPRTFNPALAPGLHTVRVPILMYHYIRNPPDPRVSYYGYGLSVSRQNFTAQMDWLVQQGYQSVTFDELDAYFQGTGELPLKPVIITFDDGYEDFYRNAVPILEAHNFVGVTYVVSGFLGHNNYMTAAQVAEVDKLGMEVGAHTEHHRDLTAVTTATLDREVAGSKVAIEAIVHHPVVDFCYPFGHVNDAVIQEVIAAGYRDATTIAFGTEHTWDSRYRWPRVRVSGGETLAQFAASVTA